MDPAMSPIYSICICNYNMADTIERALRSILDQLDDRFEVVVVDDGSSDDSVKVLKKMQEKYSALKVFPFLRDRGRKLGLTRNESIRQARGQYVLLHLDCDDLYGPYLIDFVKAFHQIERAIGRDVLVSGQHINMARRDFLLSHGPYRNMFRGEDRDLWARLAAIDGYIPFDHVDFVTRLPKPPSQKTYRSLLYTFDHILNDFRASSSLADFFRYEFKKWPKMSLIQKIFRAFCFFPAYLASLFSEKLLPAPGMEKPEQFAAYRAEKRGTLSEILGRLGATPNWAELSPGGQKIFNERGL